MSAIGSKNELNAAAALSSALGQTETPTPAARGGARQNDRAIEAPPERYREYFEPTMITDAEGRLDAAVAEDLMAAPRAPIAARGAAE